MLLPNISLPGQGQEGPRDEGEQLPEGVRPPADADPALHDRRLRGGPPRGKPAQEPQRTRRPAGREQALPHLVPGIR